jgi:hypothetical protein
MHRGQRTIPIGGLQQLAKASWWGRLAGSLPVSQLIIYNMDNLTRGCGVWCVVQFVSRQPDMTTGLVRTYCACAATAVLGNK